MPRSQASDAGHLKYPAKMPSASGSPQMPMDPPHPSEISASSTASYHSHSPTQRPTRKRPVASRPIISCEECRRRRIGCSKTQPCNSCVRLKRPCIFLNQEPHRSPRQRSSFERPLGSREESPIVEALGSSRPGDHLQRPSLYQPQDLASAGSSHVAQGQAWPPAAEDLYLRIGRMTITERMGDASRRDIVDTIELALSQGEIQATTHELAPPGAYSDRILTSIERCPAYFDTISRSAQFPHPVGPIGVPSWPQWQTLCEWYFSAVDPIAHLLSKAAFEATARYFHESILQGQTTRDSTKALVLAVSFASVASMSPSDCQRTLGEEKLPLERRYQYSIEAQLQHTDILNTTDAEIIRAAVIYLLPICSGEIAASTSAFVRRVIHNAQVAGISNFDGHDQQLSLGIQFRKQLWCQLLFLDIRTREEHGSPSTLQGGVREDALPVDVNDHEIHGEDRPKPSWTDSTFSLIRMQCYKAQHQIRDLSAELKLGHISADIAEAKLDERKQWIEQRYLNRLNQNEPIQRCAAIVGQILVSSLDLVLFEERMHGEAGIRHRMLRAVFTVVENAAMLEQDASLKQWSWYFRAYQQYKSVFILLLELQRHPRLPEEDQVTAVLDHVFGRSFDLTLWQRSREVLRVMRDQLAKMLEPGFTLDQETPALSGASTMLTNSTLWPG